MDVKAYVQLQRKLFFEIREQLQNCVMWREFGLAQVKGYEEYCALPLRGHNDYEAFFERICDGGEEDVCFAGAANFCALTSASTGASKKIPIGKGMIGHFQQAMLMQLQKFGEVFQAQGRKPPGGYRLYYGSSQSISTDPRGLAYGYLSGLLAQIFPAHLSEMNLPTPETLKEEVWEKKVEMIYRQCLGKDIQVLAGIPSYMVALLEGLRDLSGQSDLRQLMPNVSVLTYGGTPVLLYQQQLEKILGKKIDCFGMYAATESPLGIYHSRSETGESLYQFYPGILTSFTTQDGSGGVISADQLCVDTVYSLNIGHVGGLLQYQMHDMIKIKGLDPLIFEVIGRSGQVLNLAGEKITHDVLVEAMKLFRERTGQNIQHFFVSPQEAGKKICHHFTLFAPLPVKDVDSLGRTHSLIMDECLQSVSKSYQRMRTTTQVLGGTEVHYLDEKLLRPYFHRNRERGQFKMPISFQSYAEKNTYIMNNFQDVKTAK